MNNKNSVVTATVAITLWMLSSLSLAASPALKPYQVTVDNLVSDLSQHNPAAFNNTVDADTILDTAFDGLVVDAKWKTSFRNSFKKAIETRLGQKIISQMPEKSYAKLLRMKAGGKVVQALVRVDYGDMGTGYLDMHLRLAADGKVRIVDWYDYSTGQLYSESVRQIVALMSPTPTLLGKVFDVVSKRKESVNAVVEVLGLYGQKKYAETVQRFLALDEELRSNRMLNVVAVQAANLSQSDELYSKVLANLERYFDKDPTMTFLLLDHYFIEGQYDRLLRALERVQVSFGVEDAALLVLKSNALTGQSKFGPAAAQAQRAVEIEPTYENGYWSLLSALVQGKEYAKAVQISKMLEERFGIDMGPASLGANEFYAAFVESAEYRRWRKTRS